MPAKATSIGWVRKPSLSSWISLTYMRTIYERITGIGS